MPKINVYLPDELADAVRETGLPVSAICQRALEQSARRVAAIRAADLDAEVDLPRVTDRTRAALRLAVAAAREDGAAEVGSGHLLRGMLAEGQNLALRVLAALDVTPDRLRAALPTPAGGAATARFGLDAANAVELAVGEATAMGHNYVGCEHLLIGVAAEPDGAATAALKAVGLEVRVIRGAVGAALAGYVHLRAQGGGEVSASVIAAALKPLVERIEAIEARLR